MITLAIYFYGDSHLGVSYHHNIIVTVNSWHVAYLQIHYKKNNIWQYYHSSTYIIIYRNNSFRVFF